MLTQSTECYLNYPQASSLKDVGKRTYGLAKDLQWLINLYPESLLRPTQPVIPKLMIWTKKQLPFIVH